VILGALTFGKAELNASDEDAEVNGVGCDPGRVFFGAAADVGGSGKEGKDGISGTLGNALLDEEDGISGNDGKDGAFCDDVKEEEEGAVFEGGDGNSGKADELLLLLVSWVEEDNSSET
jgi:hypothetical protein